MPVRWDDRKLKKEVAFTAEQNIKTALFWIQGDAKRMVRIKTGRLRSSISVNWEGSGMSRGKVEKKAKLGDGVGQPTARPKEFVGVVGTNVEYAIPQEYGTGNMSAQPYLRPSLKKNLSRIKALFKGR